MSVCVCTVSSAAVKVECLFNGVRKLFKRERVVEIIDRAEIERDFNLRRKRPRFDRLKFKHFQISIAEYRGRGVDSISIPIFVFFVVNVL